MQKPLRLLLKWSLWFWERHLQVNKGVIDYLADGRRDQRFELAIRYLTWKKLVNFVHIELQLRFGRSRINGLPYEWEIDTTNICQLKCPLCHTGLGTVHREKGLMDFDLFTKTVDQIKDQCVWLTLYSWGEPFLNPKIHEYIRYAHLNNLATIISSNLNKPLTQEMAENIIRSGLDVLIISLDGTNQETYETYRIGGRLDRVKENIKLLVNKKQALGLSTPHLEWQFIVMRHNEHQMSEARKLATEWGLDAIVFKKLDFPHGENRPFIAERWLPRDNVKYLRSSPFLKSYGEDGQRCWRLWRSAVVNWDGGVAPCCYLADKKDDFGDLNASDIKEILNDVSYTTARNLFRKNYVPDKTVGCLGCDVYLGSPSAQKVAEK